jgi:isoleucyl-tRNA synthetase
VRAIQEQRKADDLVVTDRIEVTVTAPADVVAALAVHDRYVADQVLADRIATTEGPAISVSLKVVPGS